MLSVPVFAFATIISASLAAASACLDSFQTVSPVYIRYEGINILIDLTYSTSLCTGTETFTAAITRDGYGTFITENIQITALDGKLSLDTEFSDYSYPKEGYSLTLTEVATADSVDRSVSYIKKGDYARCNGQLSLYGYTAVESDGDPNGYITLSFQTDVDFCAGITSPSSTIFTQDPTTFETNPLKVAECDAFDLAPSTPDSNPYPTINLRCKRVGQFNNQNYYYTIRFNMVSDDPLLTTPGVEERSLQLLITASAKEQACRDTGIEWLLPASVLIDSTKPFQGSIRYSADCEGLTFQAGTATNPLRVCDRITLSPGANIATFTCPFTESEAPYLFNGLIGIIDDFLFTEYIQYNPEQRYNPDAEQCAYTISWYANGELLSGATLDFPSTSTALFAAQARYRTDGYCDTTMFADFELTNSAKTYSCSRLNIDMSGEQTVICQRVRGTMAIYEPWSIVPVTPLALTKRDRLPVPPQWAPYFYISHSDAPGASGGLRKKSGDGQVGFRSGGLRCLPGLTSCPIPGSRGKWECLDTSSKLDACGGCVLAGGIDCTELPGIGEVACIAGTCRIGSCDERHVLSSDNQTCVAIDYWGGSSGFLYDALLKVDGHELITAPGLNLYATGMMTL